MVILDEGDVRAVWDAAIISKRAAAVIQTILHRAGPGPAGDACGGGKIAGADGDGVQLEAWVRNHGHIRRRCRLADHVAGRVDDARDGGMAGDSRTGDDHSHFQPRSAGDGDDGGTALKVEGRIQVLRPVLGLGVKINIPDRRTSAEFEQRAVPLVRIRCEVDEQPLGGQIHRGLVLSGIILVNDRWQRSRGEGHASGRSAAGGIHRVVRVVSQIRRPA